MKKLRLRNSQICLIGQTTMPPTTRELYLHYLFRDGFKFNLDFSRMSAIRRVSIVEHRDLTSLENLGFERILTLELVSLPQLSSLQGLGSGRNRKIIIKACPLITDYSPLRYVHEVEIYNKNADLSLDELDHVHSLTVFVQRLFVDSTRVYDGIHNLDIRKAEISSFRGLERFPSLRLHFSSLTVLIEYLEEKGTLWNERIDICFEESFDRILFYRRWLETDFIICRKKTSQDYTRFLRRVNSC